MVVFTTAERRATLRVRDDGAQCYKATMTIDACLVFIEWFGGAGGQGDDRLDLAILLNFDPPTAT